MKSFVQLWIALSGAYCVAMFSIATWSMFTIYQAGGNQYSDVGVLYCTYYLLILSAISAVLLALQCAIIFGKIAARVALSTMIVFIFAIALFYFLVIFNLGYVPSDAFPVVVSSSAQYLILMVANSFAVIFIVWRTQLGALNR